MSQGLHTIVKDEIKTGINVMSRIAHGTAVDKGWYTNFDPDNRREMVLHLALIMTELGEAVQVLREPELDKGRLTEEMADAILRIASFCEARGLPLAEVLVAKMETNMTRPYKHGGKVF